MQSGAKPDLVWSPLEAQMQSIMRSHRGKLPGDARVARSGRGTFRSRVDAGSMFAEMFSPDSFQISPRYFLGISSRVSCKRAQARKTEEEPRAQQWRKQARGFRSRQGNNTPSSEYQTNLHMRELAGDNEPVGAD